MAENIDHMDYDDGERDDKEEQLKFSMELLKACSLSDSSVARSLLEKATVDIDEKFEDRGWSALSWAACNGHIDIVRALLALGFASLYSTPKKDEVVTKNILGTEEDSAQSEQAKLVRQNPLLWAAFKGHLEIVWLLLDPEHRLSASSTDYLQNTALHQAAAGENAAIVAEILACDGVDVWAKNARGHLALDLATDPESRALLEKAMHSHACKTKGVEFSYAVHRIRCSRCGDYFCSQAIHDTELIYAYPSSKVKERPRRLCFECKQVITNLESQLVKVRTDYLQVVAREGDALGEGSVDPETGMTEDEKNGMEIIDAVLEKAKGELVCPKFRNNLLSLKLKAICMIRLKKVCAVKPCVLVDEYRKSAEVIASAIEDAKNVSRKCDEEAGIKTVNNSSASVSQSNSKAAVVQPKVISYSGSNSKADDFDSTSAILNEWCQRAEQINQRLLIEAALTKSITKILGPHFRSLPIERILSPGAYALQNPWSLQPLASRVDEVFRTLILSQTNDLKRVLPSHLADTTFYDDAGQPQPLHPQHKLATQPPPGTLGSLMPQGEPDPAAEIVAFRPTDARSTAIVTLKPLQVSANDLHMAAYECSSLDNGRDLLLRAQRVTVILSLIAEISEVLSERGDDDPSAEKSIQFVVKCEECQPEHLHLLTEEKKNNLKLPSWVSDPLVAFPETVRRLKDLLRRCNAWDVPAADVKKLLNVIKKLDEQLITIRKLADEGKMKAELRKWKSSKAK
eukprot:GDKJ01026065.1.p1 GENE.GDKJ01026065.1~~GDKJ01026065.1.p1  ORF type:complete len:742 (+),score=156.22 GDKJ01026065.1:32-2257(+)